MRQLLRRYKPAMFFIVGFIYGSCMVLFDLPTALNMVVGFAGGFFGTEDMS